MDQDALNKRKKKMTLILPMLRLGLTGILCLISSSVKANEKSTLISIPFDEGSGTVFYGKDADGTPAFPGQFRSETSAAWTTGVQGTKALSLNGSSDQGVAVKQDGTLAVADESAVWDFWVYWVPPSAAQNQIIAQAGGSWQIKLQSTGQVQIIGNHDGSWKGVTASRALAAEEWTHITFERICSNKNNGVADYTYAVYVNDELFGEKTFQGLAVLPVFKGDLTIGVSTWDTGHMSGRIDEFRMFRGDALPGGELLYNGVQLPAVWPPNDIDPKSTEPMAVPYLENPPEIIPIDIGRQLLVDDFLIEKTDLKRTFHYPEKYSGNPVMKPETALELKKPETAAPMSGGLYWNPDKQLFELWYKAGFWGTIAYAYSRDGISWIRPELDIVPGSNQVMTPGVKVDSYSVIRDWWTDNPDAKYKIFMRGPSGDKKPAMCFESPDGIHFGEHVLSGSTGDRSSAFYNPFRQKWVFSIRSAFRGRSRHYWEADDFMTGCYWESEDLGGATWEPGEPVRWASADKLDLPDPVIQKTTQLYNLDAVAYESIMLGIFEIWRGPDNKDCGNDPKITELNFAYSRDGFHWDRPDRTAAVRAERTPGTWDRGYVQSLNNICVIRGDNLWIYYSACAGKPDAEMHGMYANCAMGIAILRRDGFASMDTQGKGSLTTRPVTFSGKHLFVNANAGSLRAEVLDENGAVIEPFTLENSVAFAGDSTIQQLTWNGGSDLSVLQNRPVRFRFELENGSLYSFWVSRDETGRSDGYIAGGGPGYTGPTDTVGVGALEEEKALISKTAQ